MQAAAAVSCGRISAIWRSPSPATSPATISRTTHRARALPAVLTFCAWDHQSALPAPLRQCLASSLPTSTLAPKNRLAKAASPSLACILCKRDVRGCRTQGTLSADKDDMNTTADANGSSVLPAFSFCAGGRFCGLTCGACNTDPRKGKAVSRRRAWAPLRDARGIPSLYQIDMVQARTLRPERRQGKPLCPKMFCRELVFREAPEWLPGSALPPAA